MQTEQAQMTETATANEGSTASQNVVTEGQPAEATKQESAASEGQSADKSAGKESEQGTVYGAPETYQFTAPEGFELGDAGIGAFSEFAKKSNLSQDAAQALLTEMVPAMAQRQAEALEQMKGEWTNSAKSDKEFGGDSFDANLATAKKALETFGTPEFSEFLETSGLGNHPEMIRVLYRAGKAISEDSFVPARGSNAAGEVSMAQRMYPNMNP